jgi:hypothetical protein
MVSMSNPTGARCRHEYEPQYVASRLDDATSRRSHGIDSLPNAALSEVTCL